MNVHDLLISGPVDQCIYAFLNFAIFRFYIRDVREKKISRTQKYLCTGIILGLYMICQLFHPKFFYDWILKTTLTTVYGYCTRELKIEKWIYISSIFFLITDIGRLFAMEIVLERIPGTMLIHMSGEMITSMHSLLVLLLTLIISNSVRKIVINDRNADYEAPVYLRVFSLLALVPYCFVRAVQFRVNDGDIISSDDILVIALILVICIIVQLIVNDHVYFLNIKRIEGVNQELLRKQQEQYQQEMKLMEDMNQKLHDMKHYINVLDGMQSMEEVKQYAADLRDKLAPLQICHKSGNALVDVILTQKIQLCYQNNIQIMPYVDAKEMGFIQTLDLCTIIGNTIDNAIDASLSVTDESKREIDVRANRVNHMIVYKVTNYFTGQLREKNGHLLTTKEDEFRHGFGLLNVEKAVEKYGGSMTYKYQNDEFVLTILIPIP